MGEMNLHNAAWYASLESDLELNHQNNPITYDNEIDDFSQPHFELHHSFFLNNKTNLKKHFFLYSWKWIL